MKITKIYSIIALLAGITMAQAPRLPLALGGQFEASTNAGKVQYAIMPFVSGYVQKIGHVKIGAMQTSFEQSENSRTYTTTDTRLFMQAGVDLMMIGGGSYLFYKFTNQKIEKDNSAGDSDWIQNHSMGVGAQHQLSPFFGITAEVEYFWNKKRIDHAAPTSAPLSETAIQMSIGVLFFIY